MATRHYPTTVRVIREGTDDYTGDPFTVIRFDCACGMTGDETVGSSPKAARTRAALICRDHGRSSVAHRATSWVVNR